MTPGFDPTLCLVTDPGAPGGVVETARSAARGGATLVQLRDKAAGDAEMTATARALIVALAPLGVPVIVNDRIEVARAAGAAGVHVGQSDAAARVARDALGPDAVVGLSIETPEQLDAVDWAAVDYVGAGPLRATPTKPDAAPALGVAGIAEIAARAPCPVVAIGGVGAADAGALRRAGVAGLAVVSAICAAPDPQAAARAILTAWRAA